ncbi:hypothetical protein EDD85DRAFT_961205 [Armillaria nabsnona]|nr:hypothetical protein EDD85DRAFT_961205 [Armillaria nabsnona]
MWSTLEIALFSIYIGVSSALFGAACVLAIQFYYKRPQPPPYINQYNVNSTVNYVLLQQPPEARVHASRRTWLEQMGLQQPKAGLTPIQEPPSSSSQPPPALPPMLFQVVQGGIRRPPTPYPTLTTSDGTGNNTTATAPITFNPNNLWDSITPSVFLSVSTFILPREPTPEVHVEDTEYPSILNWDQPVPGSQYEQIPFDESSAPEPVTRPSQPPSRQIVISEGIEIGRRLRDQWPSEALTTTIATKLLPTKAHINGIHRVHTN